MPLYDAEDLDAVLNEFLITIFVPSLVLLVVLWASFRLVFDELLLSYGLAHLTPADGPGAVATGYGRFLLLILLTTSLLLPYIAFYARYLREPLRERGLV